MFFVFGFICGAYAIGNGFFHIDTTGEIITDLIERSDRDTWETVAKKGAVGGGRGFIAMIFLGFWQPLSILIGIGVILDTTRKLTKWW